MIILVGNIQAQTPLAIYDNEFLAYTRIVNESKVFVIRADGNSITYTLSANQCGRVSTDGRYLAVSSQEADVLDIIYLPSQRMVFQTTWQENWYPCSVNWYSPNTFYIHDSALDGSRHYFEFNNMTLSEISDPALSPVPSLPNYFPDMVENFILQSPANPDIYLYERCPNSVVISNFICEKVTQFVVYNSSTNEDIFTLEGIDRSYIRGSYPSTTSPYWRESVSTSLVAWSPDGRYLAYFHALFNPEFESDGKIVIYDFETGEYLNNDPENELGVLRRPNIWRKLQWSDENVLVIWKTGGGSDEYSLRPHGLLNHFVFVHMDSQTFGYSSVFNAWNANPDEGVIFAPDSRAVAILGYYAEPSAPEPELAYQQGNFILASTTTGESTVIDTNVTEIITWRSICDFTPLDTASLISTMQSEPYSVICLAENGQYDLTAPLPDVAGDITIIGNGATINMTAQDRVFNVVYNQQWSRNGTLTLKDVTISGGNATEGGAIANTGELNLEDVIFENGE